MGRPRKGETPSESPRAIKDREARAALKEKGGIMPGTKPDPAPEPAPAPSTEPIGVIDTPKGAPEVDTYNCGNCQTVVSYGQVACPMCQQAMQWEGIKEPA